MTLSQIAYTFVFGLPVVAWGGMVTVALVLLTASCAYFGMKGSKILKFKYHKPLAFVTICVAVIHGLIGLLANLGA